MIPEEETYRLEMEPEGNAMRLGWLFVEVERVYGPIPFLGFEIFFWYSLYDKVMMLEDYCYGIVRPKLLRYLITLDQVNSDVFHCFIVKI